MVLKRCHSFIKCIFPPLHTSIDLLHYCRSTLHYPHFPHPTTTITPFPVFSLSYSRCWSQHVFPILAVMHSSPQSDLISPCLVDPPSTAPTVADRIEVRSQGSLVGVRMGWGGQSLWLMCQVLKHNGVCLAVTSLKVQLLSFLQYLGSERVTEAWNWISL